MSELELFDFLVIAILVGLWWHFYAAAHPPPGAEKPFASLAMPGGIGAAAERRSGQRPAPAGLEQTLRRIAESGGLQDVATFSAFAAQAYERIVGAFARHDLRRVENLLTPAIRSDFENFLSARAARGETASLTFIGLAAADPIAAGIDDGIAWIDMRIAAEIVSVSRDAAGRVIAGHPDRVVLSTEIWTFERPMEGTGRAWRLAATDADG